MAAGLKNIARVAVLTSCILLPVGQVHSQDQIPNPGFEVWTSGTPTGWFTNNVDIFTPVTQSTVSRTGLFAVQGKVVPFNRAALSPEVFTGIHISNHDVALTGWYQFTPASGDVVEIDVVMFAGPSRVGSGTLILSQAASTYTQFDMPIIYQPGTAPPDSCTILMFINAGAPNLPVHIGSTMLLDDLAFLVNTPLPIQLSMLAATVISAGRVELQWSTMSEFRNYSFEVQKRIDQATDFQTIPGSFTPGHGTTNVPQYYSYIDTAPGGSPLLYRLKQTSLDGAISYSDPVQVTLLTSAAGQNTLAAEFSLAQNYPNPFNPSTVISYGLPQQSDVRLEVFNSLGQRVASLVNQRQEAGLHEVVFDGTGLSSGVYIYSIEAGRFRSTKRFILLK